MIKEILDKNTEVNPNDREMAILRENFPSCFRADGTFDIERFQEYLTDKVAISHEGYELKFLGKNYARLLASVDTTTVVVPDEEHNAKPENVNSQNIYISGDNLDGLKHLLKSYAHSIKCIYIDPPYNTGSDGFVYNDNFNFTADELSVKLSIEPEQAQRILDLTKRGSASHSAWLTFMYPRLLLARDLLSDDGVIFISIDDNEQANLKLLCDDVFGVENCIADLIWNLGTGTTAGNFARGHEYILCYAKNIGNISNFSNYNDDEKIIHGALKKISNKNPAVEITFPAGFEFDGDEAEFKGEIGDSEKEYILSDSMRFKEGKLETATTIKAGFAMRKQIEDYLNGKEVFDSKGQKVKRFFFNRNGILFYEKEKTIINPKTVLSNIANTKQGSSELYDLFGYKPFDFPKPTELIVYLIKLATSTNDIVLDFFSGTATTAHAVMKLDAETSKQRKFIMVQLPEPVKSGSEAEQAGYATIDQIGMERIVRAAKKIKEAHPDTTADLGFRHYILQEPSADTLDKLEEFNPDRLDAAENNFLQEFGLPTVLATWLVRDGYGLTSPYEKIDLAGYKAFWKDKHLYLITNDLTRDAISALIDKYVTDGNFNPENIVLFGYSFTWTQREELKANLMRLKDTEKNLRINFDVRY